jgi:integrating conjugative element protein (TIGR03749 family)
MRRVVLLCVLTLCLTQRSPAVEILRWERLPLTVELIVGQERVIFLDRRVRVGVPSALSAHLRVQSAGGAAYLRASAPFATSRVQLQDVDTGALILLDVSAVAAAPDQAPLEPIRIVDAEAGPIPDGHSRGSERLSSGQGDPRAEPATPVAVVLTRYASQALYAPLRTLEPVNGVARVPLPHDLALDALLASLPVRMKPLAVWRLDGEWVTAIRISNASGRWLDMDPRALQGDFLAATFQHHALGPAGESTDTTVLYLVTRGHGLRDALLPAVSAVDASVNPLGPTHAVHENGYEK